MNTTQKISIAVLAFAATFASLHAFAAPTNDGAGAPAPAATVHYADLNVESKAGGKVLARRIRLAAQQVCASLHGATPQQAARYEACVNDAASRAIADSQRPALARLR
jgi:UrcA family protein